MANDDDRSNYGIAFFSSFILRLTKHKKKREKRRQTITAVCIGDKISLGLTRFNIGYCLDGILK